MPRGQPPMRDPAHESGNRLAQYNAWKFPLQAVGLTVPNSLLLLLTADEAIE